jgi:hypothetical protein
MMNELWLVLVGPILIAGIYGFAWLVEHYFGECRHDFGMWETIEPKNESVYIQQRFCKKCNMRQINQIRKEKNGSAL